MTGSLWPASLDCWVILRQLETLYQKKVSRVQGTTPKLVLRLVHTCDVLIYKMKKKGNMYCLLTTDTHNLIQTGLCSGMMPELEPHTQYSINTQWSLLRQKGHQQSKCSQISHYGGPHLCALAYNILLKGA